MDLERAIEIAVQAHKGASDKGGTPYILHSLAVMHNLDTDDERIVGVLHDVVEDTEWTFEKLLDEGFSVTVVNALRSVTKQVGGEDYFDFVQRAKQNPLGRKVKIADIRHNMDVTRIKIISDKDMARLNKYKKALEILINDM
jgi:(p)ppGpp synthase/HD superfamily hydrolase|tara:strand:+ start:359 stop:784 length:426 start_codon:yes stop_codon:yes gene_type:complete